MDLSPRKAELVDRQLDIIVDSVEKIRRQLVIEDNSARPQLHPEANRDDRGGHRRPKSPQQGRDDQDDISVASRSADDDQSAGEGSRTTRIGRSPPKCPRGRDESPLRSIKITTAVTFGRKDKRLSPAKVKTKVKFSSEGPTYYDLNSPANESGREDPPGSDPVGDKMAIEAERESDVRAIRSDRESRESLVESDRNGPEPNEPWWNRSDNQSIDGDEDQNVNMTIRSNRSDPEEIDPADEREINMVEKIDGDDQPIDDQIESEIDREGIARPIPTRIKAVSSVDVISEGSVSLRSFLSISQSGEKSDSTAKTSRRSKSSKSRRSQSARVKSSKSRRNRSARSKRSKSRRSRSRKAERQGVDVDRQIRPKVRRDTVRPAGKLPLKTKLTRTTTADRCDQDVIDADQLRPQLQLLRAKMSEDDRNDPEATEISRVPVEIVADLTAVEPDVNKRLRETLKIREERKNT